MHIIKYLLSAATLLASQYALAEAPAGYYDPCSGKTASSC